MMSFASKLATFKKQKLSNKKASEISDASTPSTSSHFRVVVSTEVSSETKQEEEVIPTFNDYWCHFVDEGCLGLIDIQLTDKKDAIVSFRYRHGLYYAIKYMNGTKMQCKSENGSVSLVSLNIIEHTTEATAADGEVMMSKFKAHSTISNEHDAEFMFQNGPDFVIGGVGGSGTRLIAEVIQALGMNIGYDLNDSSDNLLYTLLYKRYDVLNMSNQEFINLSKIMVKGLLRSSSSSPSSSSSSSCTLTKEEVSMCWGIASESRMGHDASWLKGRVNKLIEATTTQLRHECKDNTGGGGGGGSTRLCGWKEPNSHIYLDRLVETFPCMKYIHLVRNGMDMVKSNNQTQVFLWGSVVSGNCSDAAVTAPSSSSGLLKKCGHQEGNASSPKYSLKYWCNAHKRVCKIGSRMPKEQFLVLDYDDFVAHPDKGINALHDFLQIKQPASLREANIAKAKQLIKVKPPPTASSSSSTDSSSASSTPINMNASTGFSSASSEFRYDISIFDSEDVEYVKSLGYEV